MRDQDKVWWRAWRWRRGRAASALALLLALAGVRAVYDTFAAPDVVEERVALAGMAPGTAALRVALLSDLHAGWPDMPATRITRIVEQVNALSPDVILIAGDFLSDKPLMGPPMAPDAMAAPLARLKAPLGVYAVLGNHDHRMGAAPILAALKAAHVTVLQNEARRVGPITLVGFDDLRTGHAMERPAAATVFAAMQPPYVALAHSPDTVWVMPPQGHLLLVGHTHCGQIALPGLPLITGTYIGHRYGCGRVEDTGLQGKNLTTIITGGLGTSSLPVRLGAHPQIHLVTLRAP